MKNLPSISINAEMDIGDFYRFTKLVVEDERLFERAYRGFQTKSTNQNSNVTFCKEERPVTTLRKCWLYKRILLLEELWPIWD